MFRFTFIFITCCFSYTCKIEDQKVVPSTTDVTKNKFVHQDTMIHTKTSWKPPNGWTELLPSKHLELDLKYASKDNFTKSVIYDCGRCFLKEELTQSILTIAKTLNDSLGYGLKIYDCYRPLSAQKALWSIVPNPTYVTNPNKGSMHNRGSAIDLTIIDAKGKELDMGSPYDHFGIDSHTDNKNFSMQILKNRKLLFDIMKNNGWKGIRTEWWHFSKIKPYSGIADWNWECNIKNLSSE